MLTEQQRRFAYQVITTGSLNKAADYVGIDRDTAAEWFADPEIDAVMIADKRAGFDSALMTRERVVQKWVVIANFDPGELFMGDGMGWSLKPPEALTLEQRQCIKKISQTQHGVNVELYSRMDALDRIARAKGFAEKTEDETPAADRAKQLRELAAEMEQVSCVSAD